MAEVTATTADAANYYADEFPFDWMPSTLLLKKGDRCQVVEASSCDEFSIYDDAHIDPITGVRRVVTRLVHTASSVRFGAFPSMQVAQAAGKLAVQWMGYNFELKNDEKRRREFDRVQRVWLLAGLVPVPAYGTTEVVWQPLSYDAILRQQEASGSYGVPDPILPEPLLLEAA